MTDQNDLSPHVHAAQLADLWLSLKAARARVAGWTGFAIGPAMSGLSGRTEYLAEAGLSERAVFVMIREFAVEKLDAQAGAVERVLVAEFGVDAAALAARAAEMLGEEIGDSGLGTRDS